MLNIYFPGDELPDLPFEVDVEDLYGKTELLYNENTRLLFKLIERGELLDNKVLYKDRFGITLRRNKCSNGLKAGICTLYYPDKIINGIEVGINAIDAIAAVCHDGHIVVPDCTIDLIDLGYDVDCKMHGYRFKGRP